MADTSKKKFLALYLVPAAVIAGWMAKPAEERKSAEEKMRAEWQKWMKDHGHMVTLSEVGGKTKSVSAGGVADTKNDIMMYAFVEAPSHDAATKAFEKHPHLQIPQSTIQVMEVRAMGPM